MPGPERCGQGAFAQLVALVLVMVAVAAVMWLFVSGWAD